MKTLFARFAKDESGVTVIEYGLIGALVAVMIIAAVGLLDTGLTNAFTGISEKLTNPG